MINVAVIGCGVMGQNHIRNYCEMTDVKIVAVCDKIPGIAKETAIKFNLKSYTNYKKLIDKEHIDATSIVVPTIYHKEIALEFIKNKIPILIEKPMASSSIDALEIMKSAKKNHVLVMVGHIERFNPAINKLQELVNNGTFGDILSIVIKRVGLFPPRIKDVNVVTDLAVHDLDIIASILGKIPSSVHACGGGSLTNGREDHAEIFLDYRKFACFIQVNWVTPIKIRTLSITGTKGYAELNYITQRLDLYKSNYKLKQPKGFKEFVVEFGEPEKIKVNIHKKEPLKIELANFINSVRGLGKPKTTLEDGLSAIILSEAVKKSIKTNKIIYL